MTVDLTALEAADAALQKSSSVAAATKQMSAANLATWKQAYPPTPPPSGETRAVYVNLAPPYDAPLLALLPAIKAASYNTVKTSAQKLQSLAWMAANGMRGWLALGAWQAGGGWDQTTAQMIAIAQSAVKILPVEDIVFYVADEPAVGNTAFVSQILAFSSQLKAAVPGAKTMIAYYDEATVSLYKGLDLIAADIYPNKFGFNWKLITNPGGTPPGLADSCKAAGLAFTGIAAAASDTQPMPTAAQLTTNIDTWVQAGSQGFGVYAWGLGAEQAQYVSAVQAIA